MSFYVDIFPFPKYLIFTDVQISIIGMVGQQDFVVCFAKNH